MILQHRITHEMVKVYEKYNEGSFQCIRTAVTRDGKVIDTVYPDHEWIEVGRSFWIDVIHLGFRKNRKPLAANP